MWSICLFTVKIIFKKETNSSFPDFIKLMEKYTDQPAVGYYLLCFPYANIGRC